MTSATIAACVAFTAACGNDANGTQTSPLGAAGTAGKSVTVAGTGAAAVSGSGVVAGSFSTAGSAASGTGVIGQAGHAGAGTAGLGGVIDEDGGVTAGAGGKSASTAGTTGSVAGAGGAAGGGAGKGAGGVGQSGAGGSSGSGAASGATFTDVYKILMTSCAGATCHVGALAPADGLDLKDKATAYMQLVGVASRSCAGQKRVVAGDPTASELVASLEHGKVGTCSAPKMPDNKPMLSQANIDTVVAWVKAGALNN